MERDVLVKLVTEAGLLSKEKMERVLADPRYRHIPAEQALVASKEIEELPLYELMARYLGLPLICFAEKVPTVEAVTLISPDLAYNYQVLPVEVTDNQLVLAMVDPLDIVAEDLVRQITGRPIKRMVALPSELSAVLETLFGENKEQIKVSAILNRLPSSGGIELLQRELEVEEEEGDDSRSSGEDGPVIQIVNAILTEAVQNRASDIHVEPQANCVRVRCRIDGMLRTTVELPLALKNGCLSRFKLISGLDITEKRIPQDGRTRLRLADRVVDMRVSTLPTFHGEKIVLRILDKSKVLLDLGKLGMRQRDHDCLVEMLDCSQGMVIITGPTGSGKTSTLYAALTRLNRIEDNIITVEDPIEFQLDGISQVQVHVKVGRTFASALRAMLRQDPDIVMVGEIRDLETAEIALQAAQTGHLVLSTLHTNDAASSVSRLVQMGLPPYLVSSSLLGLVAQRLVRKLCLLCRRKCAPSPALEEQIARLATPPKLVECFQPTGCEECAFTGFSGRLGVYELLRVTEQVRALIFEQASVAKLTTAAREEGMTSMLEDGIYKVAEGITTLDEVLRVVTEELKASSGALLPAPPLLAPTNGRAIRPAETLVERGDRGLILVVDDDLMGLEFVTTILRNAGYGVLVAADGKAGLHAATSERPDLVLADINMPEMDGLTMVAHMRSHLQTAFIPVVLLTGRSGLQHELIGLQAGADDYLVKPVDPDRLLARVDAVLRRASVRRVRPQS